jgi:hypothetical protein
MYSEFHKIIWQYYSSEEEKTFIILQQVQLENKIFNFIQLAKFCGQHDNRHSRILSTGTSQHSKTTIHATPASHVAKFGSQTFVAEGGQLMCKVYNINVDDICRQMTISHKLKLLDNPTETHTFLSQFISGWTTYILSKNAILLRSVR